MAVLQEPVQCGPTLKEILDADIDIDDLKDEETPPVDSTEPSLV